MLRLVCDTAVFRNQATTHAPAMSQFPNGARASARINTLIAMNDEAA